MACKTREDGNIVIVRFSGALAVEDFSALLTTVGDASRVLFDLRDAMPPREDALQEAAIELARHLSRREARTAYLADRPIVRGWASMVAYRGGDTYARTVANEAAARQWLGATEDATEARRRTLDIVEQVKNRIRGRR